MGCIQLLVCLRCYRLQNNQWQTCWINHVKTCTVHVKVVEKLRIRLPASAANRIAVSSVLCGSREAEVDGQMNKKLSAVPPIWSDTVNKKIRNGLQTFHTGKWGCEKCACPPNPALGEFVGFMWENVVCYFLRIALKCSCKSQCLLIQITTSPQILKAVEQLLLDQQAPGVWLVITESPPTACFASFRKFFFFFWCIVLIVIN